MGATGSFPVDLVLLGMVAAFLVLRLRGILGKRTGFERPPMPPQAAQAASATRSPIIESRAEPSSPSKTAVVPDPSSPTGQVLAAMRGIDRNFDPVGFLAGAEQAFRMIVAAFAKGDRTTLRTLLSDDTYAAFEQAIAGRESAGQTQFSNIEAIESMAIDAASLRGSIADVTVRIVSDQISLTRDNTGAIVVGAEAVTELTDLWTFERDLRQSDPTWRLVAARSA
ncbi:MAG: Tim44/TimA family putative adaptor protein [Rhodospirillales bacterium]